MPITPGRVFNFPRRQPHRHSDAGVPASNAEVNANISSDDNGFGGYNPPRDITVYLKEMGDLLHDAFLQIEKLADPSLAQDVLQETHKELWQAYDMWGKLLNDCGIGPLPCTSPKTPQRPEPHECTDVCEGRRWGINRLPWRPSTSQPSWTPNRGTEAGHQSSCQSVNNRPPLPRHMRVVQHTAKSEYYHRLQHP